MSALYWVGLVLVLVALALMVLDRVLVGYRVPAWYVGLVFGVALVGCSLVLLAVSVSPLPLPIPIQIQEALSAAAR